MLLRRLGVSEEVIVEDYMKSKEKYLYFKIKYSSRKNDIPKRLKRRVWVAKKARMTSQKG